MTRLTVLLCLALCLGTGFSFEPWQQLGPAGAAVSALATVPGYPDDVYLIPQGYPARLFYTANSGLTWTLRDTIFDWIDALCLDPNHVQTMYCAGRLGKVYRSTDRGWTWQTRSALPAGTQVRQLLVNPDNGSELWAAADLSSGDSIGLTICKSTNAGLTWSQNVLEHGLEARTMLLAIDPERPPALAVGGSVNNQARLYLTDDAGSAWRDASAGLSGTCAFGAAFYPLDSTIIVCASDAGIFRSIDAGANWSQRRSAPAWSVGFAQVSPYYAYAGSDNLVYRSNDQGNFWLAETTDFYGTETRWLSINPSLGLELYAGNGAGIFHTTNGAYAWSTITDDLSCLSVPFLYFFPAATETVYTCPQGYGILKSTDQCQTWDSVPGFLGAGLTRGIAVNPSNPDTIVCVTGFDSRLHLTTDQGDSWVTYPIASLFEPAGVCYHPSGPDTLYAWGGKRDSARGKTKFVLLKSATQGQTWSTVLLRGSEGFCTGFDFLGSGETLFCFGSVDQGPALYRSTDSGGSWVNMTTGITGSAVRDFRPSPADPEVFFCATSGGVFRSLNSTLSWTDIGLENVSAILPDTLSQNTVLAGTDTQGVFLTTNAGVLWQRDTIELVSRSILFLERDPEDSEAVYCGAAGASILAHGVIGISEQPGRPIPRPAVHPSIITDKALIRLIPGPERETSIDLYHPDGRRCQRIALLQPTPPLYAWNRPQDLSPGVYLLVVRQGHNTSTTKLILSTRH